MPFKTWIIIGALLAATRVFADAVGAHLLKQRPGVERGFTLDDQQLASFETAVRMQLFHSLALVLVGLLAAQAQAPAGCWQAPGLLFLAGCALFSGGIYAWLFSGIGPFKHVVPVGGVAWIAGWIALAVVAWRRL